MFATLFSQVGLGWLLRRIPDVGGWLGGTLGAALLWFSQLDPTTQTVIITALQGNWQTLTLGSLGGLAVWAMGQWRSWRATVKPHAVTSDTRRKIDLPSYTEDEVRRTTGYSGPIVDRSRR